MAIPPIGMCSAACGAGVCGADIPGVSAAIAPLDNAVYYDPASRSIPLNADGTAQTVHPVDQEVIFDLSNELGSVPNDPTRGLDVQAIKGAADSAKLQTASDRVNLCLAGPIARGDIDIVSVTLEQNPPPGRLGLSVTYENLRLPKSTAQRQKPPTVHI